MDFFRQTWALIYKNLLTILVRRWFSTPLRALILPIVFVFVVSYSKNWSGSAGNYGIGTPTPVRSLDEAFDAGSSEKNKFVLIDHGIKNGDIGQVVSQLATTARRHGKEVHIIDENLALGRLCPGSLLGVTSCFGAVEFLQSPDHPRGRNHTQWKYTMVSDSAVLGTFDVSSQDNSMQIYELPLQHAIDLAISRVGGGPPLPETVYQYPYTTISEGQRVQTQSQYFMANIISFLAIVFFIGICGVTYHLTGFMALERENGMSQLIESMMPNRQKWQRRVVRFLSYHLSFDIIYGPSWILIGVLFGSMVFTESSYGTLVGFHILMGLSLTSYSIFASTFFRKAQLSGITVVIISILLAVAAQFGLGAAYGTQTSILVTSVLFPSMAYVNYLILNANFQLVNEPMDLGVVPSELSQWGVTGGTIMGIVVAQIFFFPLLGAVSEKLIHGVSGKGRQVTYNSDEIAVRTKGFSKHYKPDSMWAKIFCCRTGDRGTTVKAVENLTLNLVSGSITVLLGANGSGKTTTLNAIAGIDDLTAGTIQLNGIGGLGLCPQRNVMWEDLTVYEHVTIFDLLKSVDKNSDKQSRKKLIADCDLAIKMNAKAKTLSGGQKRKLQLAMMFVGGSRVCCVDEASSGIDPLARRKIWDILLAERGKRSILMTTHFLDEADVISDHIAIMSKGSLRAEGSAAELTQSFGSGFQVILPQRIPYAISSRLPHANYQDDLGRSVFDAPDSQAVASLAAELESHGLYNYHIQSPTIEDVFLKIAEEMRESSTSESANGFAGKMYDDGSPRDGAAYEMRPITAPKSREGLLTSLSSGKVIGLFQQTVILLRKRFIILRSNYMPYWSALFVPCAAAGLVTLFLKSFIYNNGLPCSVGSSGGYGYDGYGYFAGGGLSPYQFSGSAFVYGPPDRVNLSDIKRISPNFEKETHGAYGVDAPIMVNTYAEFNDYVAEYRSTLYQGGFWDGAGRPTFAWSAGGYSYAQQIQNAADSLLMRMPILAATASFSSGVPPDAGQTLQLVLYMGIAFAVFPAILALYPTLERLRNVRALHYTNGIRSLSLWLSYILFDFLWILIISVVCIGVWASQYSGWYHIGYLFFIFLLYGLAATAFCYAVSLFAKSQLSGFAIAAGYQCAVMLLYYVGYLATQVFAPADKISEWINIQYFTIALLSPTNSLLRALLMSLNEFSILCSSGQKSTTPGDITIYGGPILYLILQFIAFMGFVIYWDAGGRFTFIRRVPADVDVEQLEGKTGPAVEDAAHLDQSNDGLRVLNMSKSFGRVKAVQDITFGVRKSETFALLGPNGAGKSTLISLIRGDFRQTGRNGNIFIESKSLVRDRSARSLLGTCPQFDAIDAMSTVEHLRFYARARGVSDVEKNVRIVMEAVGLTQYQKRAAVALSGGNKRKLSLAIALVGNPSVLILDEPSSGMDAVAKRAMWKTLSSLTLGRVLVLTTHSMEEADTICGRAGIMAGRMLALGTTESLRQKYSDICYVHLVHRDAPHTSEAATNFMRRWIAEMIPEAQVETRTFGGQLRFSVRNGSPLLTQAHAQPGTAVYEGRTQTTSRAGTLFQLLEANKASLQISHYSVHPATLDQVFLSVVGEHNVQEENYAHHGERGFFKSLLE